MTSSTLFRLDGKTAAIIGGGSGIGEAVAIGAAQHGARVVVLDANAGAAVRVAASIGGGATAGTLDIRDGAGVLETPLTEPIKANADWYAAYANKSALGRWARADEMVGPTLFLASDAASFVTGTILLADGGWTAADGRFTPPGM